MKIDKYKNNQTIVRVIGFGASLKGVIREGA